MTTALLLAIALSQTPPPATPPKPVDVFAALDGRWKGQFVGYDVTGKELYRIDVEQTYETVDAQTQVVRIRDTDASGKTVTGQGKNIARRRSDGSLELLCIVEKSNGETVRHEGRVIKGADGSKQLVWYSQTKDRSETFREAVGPTGDGGTAYTIDGMGRYGETLILMRGRYLRTP